MLVTHTIPSQYGKTSSSEKNTETKKKLKLKIISSSNNVVSEKTEPQNTEHVVECHDTHVGDNDNNAGSNYCDIALFTKTKIHRSITVPFHIIARSSKIIDVLNKEMSNMLEGKCSIEGYVCPGTTQIIQHSCGRLNGGNVIFDVDLNCLICLPNEQTKISCVAKTITQAGIRAVAKGLQPGSTSPIEVFLSRDMNMHSSSAEQFVLVKEGDILLVEIIGRRFVLNDTHVTIIALLHRIDVVYDCTLEPNYKVRQEPEAANNNNNMLIPLKQRVEKLAAPANTYGIDPQNNPSKRTYKKK
jgi:hypothetical protein